MTDRRSQFALHDIVWAKVPDYPWWPGRIVKTMKEQSPNLYRVNFFGDPTYCYLQSSQLLDFNSGFLSLQEEFINDFKLQRPIQLAKAAYQKRQLCLSKSSSQEPNDESVQQNSPDSFEQTKIQSKSIIENIEKPSNSSSKSIDPKMQSAYKDLKAISICQENVLQVLACPAFQELKKCKGYNNRKSILSLNISLKEKLLEKYHFVQHPEKQDYPIDKRRVCFHHKRIVKKNQYKSKIVTRANIYQFLARKINKAAQKNFNGIEGRDLAYRMSMKIEQVHFKHKISYRKLFKQSVAWLNTTHCQQIQRYDKFLGKIVDPVNKNTMQTMLEPDIQKID